MDRVISIVGGGLAGSEAAWQAARAGVPVRLYEMRPVRPTPVHRTGNLAELVCSNSLKSLEPGTSHGLLKEEMTRLGSLIIECANANRVPAGAALAVDRERFAQAVTDSVENHPKINVVREEVLEIPGHGIVVLAVGPLVSDRLAASIAAFTGQDYLYFFDAIAPVIETDSIDRSIVFASHSRAARPASRRTIPRSPEGEMHGTKRSSRRLAHPPVRTGACIRFARQTSPASSAAKSSGRSTSTRSPLPRKVAVVSTPATISARPCSSISTSLARAVPSAEPVAAQAQPPTEAKAASQR